MKLKPTTQSLNAEIDWVALIADQRCRESMNALYIAYRKRLGSFLFNMLHSKALTEEVFNEVMLVVWRKAEQFNGDSKVSTWIYSIAYRQCLHYRQQETKHVADEVLNEFEPDQITDEREKSSQLLRSDVQPTIDKALATLSIEHRSVLELSFFVGCHYKEIGDIMDCSENTVKTRIFHAKRKLKTALERLGGRTLLET